MAFSRVLVGPKVDLDVITTAYLFGVSREDKVEVIRSGHADEADLVDFSVLCIEVGGEGRASAFCFDHHAIGGPQEAACRQAYGFIETLSFSVPGKKYSLSPSPVDWDFAGMVVAYTEVLDTRGGEALRQEADRMGIPKDEMFPTLSDIISGMLLTVRDPVQQLYAGVEILRRLETAGWDEVHHSRFGEYLDTKPLEEDFIPLFGPIRLDEFAPYVEAKKENQRLLAETLECAVWSETASGLKLAWLESNFFGAPGALYAHGAEVVVVFNPAFGQPPVPKFTVAGNNIVVLQALEKLNALESAWGGPATGTIIGSPREGSVLTLERVVEIVRQTL